MARAATRAAISAAAAIGSTRITVSAATTVAGISDAAAQTGRTTGARSAHALRAPAGTAIATSAAETTGAAIAACSTCNGCVGTLSARETARTITAGTAEATVT